MKTATTVTAAPGSPRRRPVTEQEEQEMAASVHEFAMRSRLPSDMRRAPTGETNDS